MRAVFLRSDGIDPNFPTMEFHYLSWSMPRGRSFTTKTGPTTNPAWCQRSGSLVRLLPRRWAMISS